ATTELKDQNFVDEQPIYIYRDQVEDIYIVQNCTFTRCISEQDYGGALRINISNGAQISIISTNFSQCKSSHYGGAISATIIYTTSKLTIDGSCYFDQCSAGYGGAIYANGTGQFILNAGLVINNCSSNVGGGIHVSFQSIVTAKFNGVTFKDCSSTYEGGGLYIDFQFDSDYIKFTGDITFDNCSSQYGGGMLLRFNSQRLEISTKFLFKNCISVRDGGGMSMYYSQTGSNVIMTGDTTFINCTSLNYGGGTQVSATQSGTVEIIGQKFKDCSSQYFGGALSAVIQSMGQLIIRGLEIENCSSLQGGGLYLQVWEGQLISDNLTVKNCTGRYGGGMFAFIGDQGQVILDNNCEFLQCTSNKGNGGGIYVNSDSLATCQFQINDALIKECQAIEDELNDVPPTGYGGGIFVTGSEDYNVFSKRFNLKGLKMIENTASRRGQSIYIAMTKVVEWCKLGIAGEYVKGNYS
ncbi:MAG: hypothetical protein EZS28_045301, partial [Streblomastix strix]